MANIIRLGGGAGGVTLDDFIDNVASNNARLAGWSGNSNISYIVDDNNYGIFAIVTSASNYNIWLQHSRFSRGNANQYLGFSSSVKVNLDSTLATDGRTNFYPIELSEYQKSWGNVYPSDYNYDITGFPMYNKLCRFKGMQQANTHPAIYSLFGDEKWHNFANAWNSMKIKDLINFTLYYPLSDLKCVFFCKDNIGASWDASYWISLPKTSEYYYDTDNNYFVFGNSSGTHTNDYKNVGNFNALTTKADISLTIQDNGLWRCPISVADLQTKICFNTMAIKDQNGNVVLPANCTLADLGIT